jgi:hypothetical protein
VRIETAARKHKLTNSQRAKRRLAGKGDIKRFFDHVEHGRSEFELNRTQDSRMALRLCAD